MRFTLFLVFFVISTASYSQNRAYNIFKKATVVMSATKTMSYSNFSKERVDGKIKKGQLAHIKLQRNPLKIHLKQNKDGGAEILFDSEKTTKTALVNPGTFPYINLNLDPVGSIMHKGEHHSLLQADINYTFGVINYSLRNKGDKNKMSYINTVIIKGVKYHKIDLNNSDYKIYNYTVLKDEDLIKIANKLRINYYSIIELNSNINSITDVNTGQIIKVPNHYAKSTIMYINTESYFLFRILVYDNDGLFESYELRDLKIDVKFKPNEFSRDFPDYNF